MQNGLIKIMLQCNGRRSEITTVKFYESTEDSLLKFAVIISKTQNRYVFCKHKDRNTWEIPGGHREQGETIMDTARRELYEETGALNFETQLHSEIEKIVITENLPERWTYPDIQPHLMKEAGKRGYL